MSLSVLYDYFWGSKDRILVILGAELYIHRSMINHYILYICNMYTLIIGRYIILINYKHFKNYSQINLSIIRDNFLNDATCTFLQKTKYHFSSMIHLLHCLMIN